MLAVWLCVLAAAFYAQAVDKILKKRLGDEVTLEPGSSPQPITSITWKHGENLAVQWEGPDTDIDKYRQFLERGRLNVTNARMTITGLTHDDGGIYTWEVNNVRGQAIHLMVFSPVPKPVLTESCDAEKIKCTLTCDGDAAGAGPLTYRWWSDGGVIAGVSQKTHDITKEGSGEVKEFSCELQNDVSSERSQTMANPFLAAHGGRVIPGLVVFFSLLVIVVLLVFVHRMKTGTWFFNKDSKPWEADFWRRDERGHAAESNGTASSRPVVHTGEEVQML